GVGTSALALHVAHRLGGGFADGQVYLDLRGVASRPSLNAAGCLRRILLQLGLAEPASNRSADLDAAADRLHGLLSHGQVLFVMDTVDHPAQVRRLLVGGPGCRFLVAGSVDLDRLPVAEIYDAHELSEDAAVDLLATVGDPVRVDQDRAAAVEMVNRLG